MRYEKDERLLRLAIFLQADSLGRSLEDIMHEFEVSRRTAERMRDAIERVFPQLQEVESTDRLKRWKIPSRIMNSMLSLSSQELVATGTAIGLLRENNFPSEATALDEVLQKLKAMQAPNYLRRIEPDAEALMEAEGLAMRPGPKPRYNPTFSPIIREAILSFRKVRIYVRYRTTGKRGYRTVCPYGFLYGNRHYLVADTENPSIGTYRLFSLSDIENVALLDECFNRDESFTLREFAENSFGVFQEEPFDVCWKFSPNVAREAKEHRFHPTQQFTELEDGSLLVRFKAGGRREMDWHLYMWGENVEVLEPADWTNFKNQRPFTVVQ